MVKKQIIAVDIDDVLSSQSEVVIAFSNAHYDTKLTREDLNKPGDYWGYYESLWDVDKEEGARRFNEFKQQKHPLKQVIEPETKLVIARLAKKFRLELVTTRTGEYRHDTDSWLQEHLPDVFEGLHFIDLWDEPGEKATKAKVCKEIGAGYLIDDNVEHCNLAAEAGVHALLFDNFGWNINKPLHSAVIRVADWQAVAEYFGV